MNTNAPMQIIVMTRMRDKSIGEIVHASLLLLQTTKVAPKITRVKTDAIHVKVKNKMKNFKLPVPMQLFIQGQ